MSFKWLDIFFFLYLSLNNVSFILYLFIDSTKTPKHAVFAGSMQLLAGIKLCTGRILTNHPHYEDNDLRERTRQVGFVYTLLSNIHLGGNITRRAERQHKHRKL